MDGAYLMRAGEALRPMTFDELRRISQETGPDFSIEICNGATLDDLDLEAISTFLSLWNHKSVSGHLHSTMRQRLEDAERLRDGKVTFAALILFGTHRALGRYLPQAEIIFEYRSPGNFY